MPIDKLAFIGLGNPDNQYSETRHNIGKNIIYYFQNALRLKLKHTKFYNYIITTINNKQIYLFTLNSYMNNCGYNISQLIDDFDLSISQLFIIHDDLDLDFENLRIKFNGGNGGHNGLKSIEYHLKSNNFFRLRIGIGRPEYKEMVVNYVLSPFNKNENNKLIDIFKKSFDIFQEIIYHSPKSAMDKFNTKNKS